MFAEDYPSWDEVEAAKADVSAREAEATRITGFVDELEAEAGRLGDAAVEAAAASSAAEAARAAAEGRAGRLRTAADAAQAEADASAARLGRIGAVLARSGGADVTLRLLFGADDDADLLVGLSRAAQLTNIYGGVAARATAARADAAALSEQADVAEAERTRLAAEAAAAAEAAEAAHEAAEAQVVAQQAVLDTLYAQLASLRDRTVELERQYRIGEQAAQERAAREAAAAAAAAAAGGGSDDVGAPPPGVVVDRAGAKAYAASRHARLRLGLRPVPLPRPALDPRIRLAGRRVQCLERRVRDPPVPARQQDGQCRRRLAHQRRDPDRLGPRVHRREVRIALRRMGPLGGVQLVLMLDHDEREVFRRHGAEGVLLAGGGAAILLQLADPRVARGVAAHSGFRERPLDRLLGTLDYVYAVGFGDDDTVAAAVRAVNARHVPVRGAADGGRPAYSAFDADAQRWVASTLLGVALALHERIWGPLDEPTADAVVRGYAPIGFHLQATREGWPETRAEFDRWWTERLARLEVGGEARSVARSLLSGESDLPPGTLGA